MRQLTYISTASQEVNEVAVAEILRLSRLNNAAANVTGLLLYDGRRFLQALEGESHSVEATYNRIKHDPRHRAVVLLSARDVTERAFGEWAMAAQRAKASSATSLPEQVDALTATIEDANLRELFRGFARVRAAA